MNTKTFAGSVASLIIVGMLAFIVWGAAMRFADHKKDTAAACTQDAMQCPDGTWVGRTGADCSFACPQTTATSSPEMLQGEAALGQSIVLSGTTLTPLKVLEDSRCPEDVQCIQAGTVRLLIQLQSATGVATSSISLHGNATTEAGSITFTDVAPAKQSKHQIKENEYVFSFTVDNR